MLDKIKTFLFQGVILRKVVGKFVKHAIGGVAGLVAAHPVINDIGITIDWKQLEAYAIPALVGLFGAGWNYIEHRFVKKT